MKIFIVPKHGFEKIMGANNITLYNIEDKKNVFFISIIDPDDTPIFNENRENLLVTYFYDITKKCNIGTIGGEKVWVQPMTLEQGEEIFKFIEKHKDKEACIVHCHAGVSRSGAVGTFIRDYTNSDLDDFKQTNPYISPNQYIYKTLKSIWEKQL